MVQHQDIKKFYYCPSCEQQGLADFERRRNAIVPTTTRLLVLGVRLGF